MSVTSGFFNSVNGDRTYNADDLNNFFNGILNDGVFKNYDGELAVTVGSGMSVNVAGGKAIVFGKYIKNTGSTSFEIAAGGTQPRYDAIVIGVNLENRTGDIYVKQGTPAASPSYPSMFNTVNMKEICLAYVYVPANATSISSSNITDTRSDESICGWVKFSNISARLNVLRNNVTVNTSGTNTVSIGIPEFAAGIDTLFVYLNGLLMIETNEYIVNGTGSTASIELVNAISGTENNVFSFVVFKMEV